MDGIARRIAFDVLSEVDDLARALVAERDGDDAERIPLPLMNVRSADATALDTHQNVVVVELGNGEFLDLDVLGSRQHGNLGRLGDAGALGAPPHFAEDLADDVLYLRCGNVHILCSFP